MTARTGARSPRVNRAAIKQKSTILSVPPDCVQFVVCMCITKSINVLLFLIVAFGSSSNLWSFVQEEIDAYSDIKNCTVIISGYGGRYFSYTKGAVPSAFNVASASKWVTAIVIARMVDQVSLFYR
jgi:hypothetical protein